MVKMIPTKQTKINFSRIISTTIILIVILFIGGLIYFNTRATRNGPLLTLLEPNDGETIHASKVTLRGVTERTQSLYINNDLIALDPNGGFLLTLPLPPGESIITLRAQDKFNKELIKIVHLYAQYPHTPLSEITTVQPVLEESPPVDTKELPSSKETESISKGTEQKKSITNLEIINNTTTN